jgi:hypothetical protein
LSVSHDNSDDITSVQWLRLHRHTTTMHMILAKPECARWISSRSTKAGGLTYTTSSYIHKMPLTVSLRVQNVVHDSTFEGSTKAGGLTTASSYIHKMLPTVSLRVQNVTHDSTFEGSKRRPRVHLRQKKEKRKRKENVATSTTTSTTSTTESTTSTTTISTTATSFSTTSTHQQQLQSTLSASLLGVHDTQSVTARWKKMH